MKEKRRAGPAVWVFRWREDTLNGRANRKTVLGSIEQFPTKLAALKAAEALRINASAGNPAVPVTVRQLVKHYVNNELPSKAHSTQRTVKTSLNVWVIPSGANEGFQMFARLKSKAGCVGYRWQMRQRPRAETSCTPCSHMPVDMNG